MKVTPEYLQRLREAWFEESLAHLKRCGDENCDWANRFNCFLLENGVSRELREKWHGHLCLTPDHRDFKKPLPTDA